MVNSRHGPVHFKDREYILIVYYFSKYVEVIELKSTKSEQVIKHVKSVFARYGIPSKVVTDNGPQFACDSFRKFSMDWDFKHVTSSPLYFQSNGMAERHIQTVKCLMYKACEDRQDPYLALLALRNTPNRPRIRLTSTAAV